MGRHPAEWWAKRVDELAHGGDAEAIARQHGVRTRTLIWWRSQLRKQSRDKKRSRPRLLPVVVRASSRPVATRPEHGLEVFVEVGTTRMTLRGSVTGEHLYALHEEASFRRLGVERMLLGMEQHDVSGWVSSLEARHGWHQTAALPGADEVAKASLRGAMAALEPLHEPMLRAEVRTTFAERAAGRGDG